MKIYRLLGIVTLLLQTEKMTATELAKRFEVSKRTINRDIEDICRAGIPVTTLQGVKGGVSIMGSYKIDKALFTGTDLRAILAGLSSLNSVSQGGKYQGIIEKFSTDKKATFSKNNIVIDLSSFYKDTLAPKIETLEKSIDNCRAISFTYHNQKGENFITIDPYLIVFQWSSWYVFGFNPSTGQFKLYKLTRICDIKQTGQVFELRDIPEESLAFSSYFTDEIKAVVDFDKGERYRLIEEYGENSFEETSEGKLRFSSPFTNQSYLLNWVLGFGEKAELIQPAELRAVLRDSLKNTLKKYVE